MHHLDQINSYRRQSWMVGLLALTSLAVHLYFAWQPLDRLVATFVGDDMFYYLQIARNIARGHGSTFDSVTLTNGYHPVYMLFVVALFAVFPGQNLVWYVQASLTILSVATVITGILLFFVARRLFGGRAAVVTALLWLLNPYILGTAHIGVEVALAALMFSVSMLVYLRVVPQWTQRQPLYRETYLLGMLLGITCLCRTDSMFFAFCMGLAILWVLYQSPHTRRWWGHFFWFVVGGATFILPWFAWNLAQFGTIVQDSARALTSLKHGLYVQHYGWWAIVTHKWPATFSFWLDNLTNILCMPSVQATSLLLLGIIWTALRPNFAETSDNELVLLPQLAMIRALLFALWMSVVFYAGYFWFMQKWYFLGPAVLVVVLAGGLYHKLENMLVWQVNPVTVEKVLSGTWGTTALLLLGLFVWQGSVVFRTGFYPWQKVYYDIALHLQSMPAHTKVGAFNTGVYGYIMDRGVVNLDGVVNGQVLQAMKQKRLLAYLRQRGITHIVDHVNSIKHFATFAEPAFQKSFLLRGRYPVQTTGGDLVILELRTSTK